MTRWGLVFGAALACIFLDLLSGYPSLPWWQRAPHDFAEAAVGIALWNVVVRPRLNRGSL